MSKNEKISVVGAGVVGEATGRGFLDHGYEVQFVDVNPDVISRLREQGFDAYTPRELAWKQETADVTVFTVSTPTEDGRINLEYLRQAALDLGKRLARTDGYHLAVVRSTVSPGTTEDVVIPTLEEYSLKKAGKDFGVCMNPEYLREVSAIDDFARPWIITIGELDARSGELLERLYAGYNCPKYRVSIREAEMQKYVHNLYNAAKISFFNEMRGVANKFSVDADKIFPIVAESCEGMWNPRYGIKNLGPYSGMCLPKDTQAFLAWAYNNGWDLPLLRSVIAVNDQLVKEGQRTAAMPIEAIGVRPDPS